ncbi:MAG: hypothetical protein P8P83_01190 [Rickettsiaceae bacterium]|nr:hypothetical protein [Rickettsiaceae bacterium]
MPATKEGVEKKFNQLDNEIIAILKQYKSPTDYSIEIEKCINKEKNFLIESLTENKPIFAKIVDIEKSTNNLNYSIKKHISSFPRNIQYTLAATLEKLLIKT